MKQKDKIIEEVLRELWINETKWERDNNRFVEYYKDWLKDNKKIKVAIEKALQSQKQKIIKIIKNWSGIVNKEELLKSLGEKEQ